MANNITHYNSINDFLTNINDAFPNVDANDLRDFWINLTDLTKPIDFPEDTLYYTDKLDLEGLEVVSEDKISSSLISGIEKYKQLKYSQKSIPPIFVVRGGVRELILYGETHAVEAFKRKAELKAFVIDLGDEDIFEFFNIDPNQPIFLVPLLERLQK